MPPPPTHVASATLLGRRCPYRLTGDPRRGAPPAVLLGGAFQEARSWARFETALAGERAVLALDLPGSGGAELLPARHGVDDLARALEELCVGLDLPPVYLVGTSYGSPVALRFAQTRPERVARLVLAGTMRAIPDAVRPRVERTLADLERGDLAAFARRVVDGLTCRDPRRPVARREQVERFLLRSLGAMTSGARRRYRENTRRLLDHPPLDPGQAVAAPTLVFTGEHDVFTPPAANRAVAAAIPGAWFTTLREADHLFHLERFEETAELLRRFGRGQALAGAPGCNALERPGVAARARRLKAG